MDYNILLKLRAPHESMGFIGFLIAHKGQCGRSRRNRFHLTWDIAKQRFVRSYDQAFI